MPYWDYTGDTKASFDKKHGGWNPITGGGGGNKNNNNNNNNPPKGPTAAEIAAAKAKAEAEKRRLEAEARKKHLINFKDTQKEKIKKFEELVDTKGYDSTIATDEEKKLYDDWYTATGKKEKITHPVLINSESIQDIREKDGKTKTFITDKSSLEDLITGDINKETYIETPELGSVTTFLNPENAIGPQSWAVNPGKPRFTIEELKAKGLKNGGILDITGDEQITTDEGNDISLVDESETGVSTLFRAKNGGNATKNIKGQPHMLAYITPGEAKTLENLGGQKTMTKEGIPAYPPSDNYGGTHGSSSSNNNNQGSDHSHSRFDSGYYGGTTTTSAPTGDDQEDDVATMETNMGVTTDHSPNYTGSDLGWVVSEDEETEIGGADYIGPKDKVRIHNEILNRKKKYDNPLEQGKRAFGLYRSFPKPTGIPLVDILSFGYFAYKQNEKKKERIAEIDADLELLDKIGATKFTPHTDTLYQTLEQEKLDLTQPKSPKDSDGGDTPPAPVVAPVTEEIEDSYAMAGNWLQGYRDLKAKQALSASLQEKWADEREWQQETMFANSGGLANLFRVKNQ